MIPLGRLGRIIEYASVPILIAAGKAIVTYCADRAKKKRARRKPVKRKARK